jgi:sporulation protein YlmC with PRC-barrel domain
MAGSGIRVFASGEILTAAQVNGYLMDQAVTRFADAFTRDAAFGGVGQPVLTEGRICYLDDVNLIQFYDGASWVSSSQFTVGDGTITEAKLAANSVTSDKIAPGTVIAADIAAGTITATELADGAVTSGKILDGTIVNADINASAAIALSKLATSTAGNIIVYNSSGVPTAVAETGDVTISDTGVTAIASGVIVNADISATAAIEIGKIADVTIDTKTANYTLVLTDKNKFIEMNLASANTVSVPTNSVAFPIGSQIHITQYGTGKTQVVAVTPGTTTIRSAPGTYLRAQYSSATLIKRATEEWYLVGDLSLT